MPAQQRFVDRVCVVTASTKGIGFAIAKRFVEEGGKVVVSSRKQNNVDEAVKQLKAIGSGSVFGLPCHVGKSEDRKELMLAAAKEFGGIDVLVSNAGSNPVYGPMMSCVDDTNWDKVMDNNVKASFFVAKEALPHMKGRVGANMTFIASICGHYPVPNLGLYNISKAALLSLAKNLSAELGPAIRVNAIAPGIIKTDFSSALTEDEKLSKYFLAQTPAKRFGLASEIASTAAFLASDDAAYVSGETIVAAGGMHVR